MTEQKDLLLQTVFAKADSELQADGFVDNVLLQVHKKKRRVTVMKLCFALVSAALIWMLAEPIQNGVYYMMQGLFSSVSQIDNQLMSELLAPVNNIAALLALSGLVIRKLYKKTFYK